MEPFLPFSAASCYFILFRSK